ncbi:MULTISPECIES: hypothetical protein [unclassified Acinetobacter]|uniref:hypothetical protein n=1 Tax=unclassified Acinetobacter TaxID=196816 RepID=UPI0035BB541B
MKKTSQLTHYRYHLLLSSILICSEPVFANTTVQNNSDHHNLTPQTTAAPVSPQACIGLSSNSDRLACYDQLFPPSAVRILKIVLENLDKISVPI